MSIVSIDGYWGSEFSGVTRIGPDDLPLGWICPSKRSEWFVEPTLTLREGYGHPGSMIKLVAAPGAVGKSTYAQNLAATHGLVLVDLAQAETIGGNAISGGFTKGSPALLSGYVAGALGLVIDGLDEARARVTEQAFFDFLRDLAIVSSRLRFPIVLLGRSAVIDDCFLWFGENETNTTVFDIEFFDSTKALVFLKAALHRRARDRPESDLTQRLKSYAATYFDAAGAVLSKLQEAEPDADNQTGLAFSGYAPVLEAVATLIAEETNPSTLLSSDLSGKARDVVFKVVDRILIRESEKLRNGFADISASIRDVMYDSKEQRERLYAQLLGFQKPPINTLIPAQLQQRYNSAVTKYLNEHPFLDGQGTGFSGAVFEADLMAYALQHEHEDVRGKARMALEKSKHAPNPFLVDFIEHHNSSGAAANGRLQIVPELVGIIDSSMRARIRPGQFVSLDIDQDLEMIEIESVLMQIREGQLPRTLDERLYLATVLGTIRLPHRVSDVNIVGDDVEVSLGNGDKCELGAPILIDVDKLIIQAREMVVFRERASNASGEKGDIGDVTLIANSAQSTLADPPALVDDAELNVSWSGAGSYPWTAFSRSTQEVVDQALADAQRALRRLIISFRSHSKGRLARYKAKIEHRRMTKGETGTKVREALVNDGVLTTEGNFYFLDPSALSEKVGTDFGSLRVQRFSDQTTKYLSQLL